MALSNPIYNTSIEDDFEKIDHTVSSSGHFTSESNQLVLGTKNATTINARSEKERVINIPNSENTLMVLSGVENEFAKLNVFNAGIATNKIIRNADTIDIDGVGIKNGVINKSKYDSGLLRSISGEIRSDQISNDDIKSGAGIKYEKLNLENSITNNDISAKALITDDKLHVIMSKNKIANSATSATQANIANTIVMRDNDGSFEATTLRGNLQGAAERAINSLHVLISEKTDNVKYYPVFAGKPGYVGLHSNPEYYYTAQNNSLNCAEINAQVIKTSRISNTSAPLVISGSRGITLSTGSSGSLIFPENTKSVSTWPVSNGAAGSILTDNGSGNLYWSDTLSLKAQTQEPNNNSDSIATTAYCDNAVQRMSNGIPINISEAGGYIVSNTAPGQYGLVKSGMAQSLPRIGTNFIGNNVLIDIDPSDYRFITTSVKKPQLRIKCICSINSTQNVMGQDGNIKVELFPVSSAIGSPGINYTLAKEVKDSTLVISKLPASSINVYTSGNFDMPNKGVYMLAITTNKIVSMNGFIGFNVLLQVV
jgi:hypothetical protein